VKLRADECCSESATSEIDCQTRFLERFDSNSQFDVSDCSLKSSKRKNEPASTSSCHVLLRVFKVRLAARQLKRVIPRLRGLVLHGLSARSPVAAKFSDKVCTVITARVSQYSPSRRFLMESPLAQYAGDASELLPAASPVYSCCVGFDER